MMDDDFCDLYADVEAQASSVIKSIQNYASTYARLLQEEDAGYGNAEKLKEGSLLESDSKKVVLKNLGNLEADGSDSEDDFNIVANDEDCERFVVGSGRNGSEENEYDDPDPDRDVEECLGKNGLDKSGFDPNGNGSEGGNGVKDVSLRHSQYKLVQHYGSSFPSNRKGNESWVGSCSSQSVSANWEVNRSKQQRPLNPLVSHGRHGFSLPWYRTILDINIDGFEEKPWCYPGVDLSDFFNFGFDEDSWKQYCISTEKIRQQSYMHSRKAIHGLSKLPQPYEVGYEHERIAEEGESSPKAAEKGEGHLKLPKGRAIQVEYSSGDRQPTINLRCPRDWDSDVVIQVNVQDSDDNCLVSYEEEENTHITKTKPLSSKDLNTDDIRDNRYSCSGSKNETSASSSQGNVRCSQLISESDQMSLDLDDHNDNHVRISEKDVAEALETVEMAVEECGRNISKSDQCIIESELSFDDRSHLSPTISYSASDVGTSRDGDFGVCEDSPHPLRTSGPQLQDSGASNTKDTKSNCITNKPGTSQNCMREKSSIWERHKHLDRDPSPTRGGHSSFDRGRHIGRMDDDYRNAEEFSYHRKRDFSSGYNNVMFADRHFCSDYTKHSRGRYGKNTRDETRPQDRRDWNDREHFHRKCFPLGKQNDQYDRRRGFCMEGTFPSVNWKSRRSISAYSFKGRDVRWRGEGENIPSGKRINRESYLPDKTNEDFIKEKRRFNSFDNQRRDSFDGKHRRGGVSARRESFILGNKFRCDDDPSMGLDRSRCMEIDDEYPNHHQYIHPRSHREFYATNEGRWQDRRPPRSGMFDFRFAGKHRRQIFNAEGRNNGWVGRYDDSESTVDGIVNPVSDVELTRRNYGSQSSAMHETQYEPLVRYQDAGLYVDSISCSNRVIPRHDEIRGNHRYEEEEEEEEEGMVVGDMNFERHRHKMIGEESEVKCDDENSNLMYGDEQGQMPWRCLGPLDLIAEEEKSPGRQSDGGSMLCNGKLETMDLNFVEDQTNMKNFEEIGIQIDMLMIEADHDNLKWLDKFPVTEHNDDLDIEDGQIITEDPNIKDNSGKIYVLDSAAPNRSMEKNIYCENASRDDANGGYDDQHIQDTVVKMEKRRERFKDTATLKTKPDQYPILQVDSVIDPVETKMERPTRKRQWGGR